MVACTGSLRVLLASITSLSLVSALVSSGRILTFHGEKLRVEPNLVAQDVSAQLYKDLLVHCLPNSDEDFHARLFDFKGDAGARVAQPPASAASLALQSLMLSHGTPGSRLESAVFRVEHLSGSKHNVAKELINDVVPNRVLEEGGTIHLYASSPGASALANHTDVTDIFVLQLDGAKEWLLCQERGFGGDRLHNKLDTCSTYGEQEINEVTLYAGDALYLPRRVVHSARARPDQSSVHLTFGFAESQCSEHDEKQNIRTLQGTCNKDEGGRSCDICNSWCDANCPTCSASQGGTSCDSNCNSGCDDSCDSGCNGSCDSCCYGVVCACGCDYFCDVSCDSDCDEDCNENCDSGCSCDAYQGGTSCDYSCDSGCDICPSPQLETTSSAPSMVPLPSSSPSTESGARNRRNLRSVSSYFQEQSLVRVESRRQKLPHAISMLASESVVRYNVCNGFSNQILIHAASIASALELGVPVEVPNYFIVNGLQWGDGDVLPDRTNSVPFGLAFDESFFLEQLSGMGVSARLVTFDFYGAQPPCLGVESLKYADPEVVLKAMQAFKPAKELQSMVEIIQQEFQEQGEDNGICLHHRDGPDWQAHCARWSGIQDGIYRGNCQLEAESSLIESLAQRGLKGPLWVYYCGDHEVPEEFSKSDHFVVSKYDLVSSSEMHTLLREMSSNKDFSVEPRDLWALVDFFACLQLNNFVGNSVSTFSAVQIALRGGDHTYWYNSQSIPLGGLWDIYKVPIVYTYTEQSSELGKYLLRASISSVREHMPHNPIHILYHGHQDNDFRGWLRRKDVLVHEHNPSWSNDIETMRQNGDPAISNIFLHSGNYLGTWQRIDIPLFIDAEYCLYLDSDTLVQRPFSFADLGLNLTRGIAMSSEQNVGSSTPWNAGVMLMNVPYLRETHEDFMGYIFQHVDLAKFDHPSPSDQGAYLSFYKKMTTFLPAEFNFKPYWPVSRTTPPNPYILHFHGAKPHDYMKTIMGRECDDAIDAICKRISAMPMLCSSFHTFATSLPPYDRTAYCNSSFQDDAEHTLFCVALLEWFAAADEHCEDFEAAAALVHSSLPDLQAQGADVQGGGLMSEHSTRPQMSYKLTIFYNAYIPMDRGESAVRKALDIVTEQLSQINMSHATLHGARVVDLFYNTIGSPEGATKIEQICAAVNSVNCIHMRHYMFGNEELTLGSLYDFCASSDEGHVVVYLHNKGSYHNGIQNDNWRRHLTNAATSEHCLRPMMDEIKSESNICGLSFAFARAPFYPGNMWTAKCNYINKLQYPSLYRDRMTEVVDSIRHMAETGRLVSARFPDAADYAMGIRRYSAEFWACSHPRVVPSDVAKITKHVHWLNQKGNSTSEFEWSLAPRYSEVGSGVDGTQTRSTVSERVQESSFLAGQLLKWYDIYGEAPPATSWVWEWYPDGDMWRTAVEKHGKRAVQVLTDKFVADE